MSVETIIILGIAAVFCILLTNRFNLIGPVVLIAVGVGTAFIPSMAEAQARRTRTVRVDDVHLVGVRSRAPIDAVHRLGRQRDAHAPTLRNRVHVARILAVGRLVPPIGGRAQGRTDT